LTDTHKANHSNKLMKIYPQYFQ